jgi:hypothetical protein
VDLTDGQGSCWVQLSRGTATDLGLEPGDEVWVARLSARPATAPTTTRVPTLIA